VDISRSKTMTMLLLPPVRMMVMMFFVWTTTTTTTLAFTYYYNAVPIVITKRFSATLPTRPTPRVTTTTAHFMSPPSLPHQHSPTTFPKNPPPPPPTITNDPSVSPPSTTMVSVILGPTEQLLLLRSKQEQSLVRQEYGRTIQQDGWDGLRSMIWWIFQCTEYIFPLLGGLLTCGLILNLMGYGYYFDTTNVLSTDDTTAATTTTTRLVIDTLEHIRQQNQLLSYSVSSISSNVPPVVVVTKDVF
jgi:hypothetical protein